MKNITNKSVVLVLAHCLLNPKVRAKGLSQHPEIKKKMLKLAEKYNAKIKQLPCPEFLFLGEREPKTYDEYMEVAGFKDSCEKLAEIFIDNLGNLEDHFFVIIGIARSPSCAISHVYDRHHSLKKGKGIFVRSLRKKIKAVFVEIDYREIEASIERIEKILETFC